MSQKKINMSDQYACRKHGDVKNTLDNDMTMSSIFIEYLEWYIVSTVDLAADCKMTWNM